MNTVTGPWEKRNLPKMAGAMPPWVSSDHLTLLGIAAAFVIGAGYALTWVSRWWLWLSNVGLALHWFADSLDGTLARVRHRERERYGYFVDHLSDALTTLLICVGLGISPLMDMRIALFLAIGYFMLNIYAHIAAYARGVFRLSYGRIGPTEVRMVIFVVNLVVMGWNPVVVRPRGHPLTSLDICGLAVGVIFLAIFVVYSIRDARHLDRLDRATWRCEDEPDS